MTKNKKIDYVIVFQVILLAIISITTIYSASTYLPEYLGNLAIKQFWWYIIGFFFVIIVLLLNNDRIYKTTFFLYILGNILLLLLLFFASPINNSKCWFTIPAIGSFQPSEFMKIILIITLAVMIDNFKKKHPNPSCKEEFIFLIKSFIITLIPSVLTFLEPDTGVVMIYFIIWLVMLFICGIRLRFFVIFAIIGGSIMAFLITTYFFKQDLFIKIFGTKLFYRLDRLLDWSNGTGLQLENAMAAIGSSGWLGHGFNKTPIYFPESGTDFIFAVFASNFGLIGSLLLLAIIVWFDLKLISLAKQTHDSKNRYLLVGIISMIVFQQVQNIGMTLGLLPIMGITLPFISYGGSCLISYMIMIGMVLNISKET